ncbi:MAG TPA: hypothetical protein VIH52_00145 [Candidatus Nanoarchaeia archaeon]|nr:hypothetical protein [uncultured archaeon]
METGINLIPELTEKEIKSGVYRRKANLAAIGALASVGLIILLLIAYRGYLFIQARGIENRTSEVEKIVVSFREVEISTLTLKEKLTQIDKLLKESLPASEAVGEVIGAAGTSTPIAIKNLNISDTGEILVEGAAVTSEVFAEWVDKLTSGRGAQVFSKINLVSLVKNESGFGFSIRADFTKRGVLPSL